MTSCCAARKGTEVRGLLITLTAVEIVIFLGAVVVYLVRIARSLQATSTNLAKVSFGVAAIEMQCAPIGPVVTRINGQLEGIVGALTRVVDLAEARWPADNGQPPQRSRLERVADTVVRRERPSG